MAERVREALQLLVKVRGEMIEEGYHFPNEQLADIDYCVELLGGKPLNPESGQASAEVFRSRRGKRDWWWRLKAANGQVLAGPEEGYRRKAGALGGLHRAASSIGRLSGLGDYAAHLFADKVLVNVVEVAAE